MHLNSNPFWRNLRTSPSLLMWSSISHTVGCLMAYILCWIRRRCQLSVGKTISVIALEFQASSSIHPLFVATIVILCRSLRVTPIRSTSKHQAETIDPAQTRCPQIKRSRGLAQATACDDRNLEFRSFHSLCLSRSPSYVCEKGSLRAAINVRSVQSTDPYFLCGCRERHERFRWMVVLSAEHPSQIVPELD